MPLSTRFALPDDASLRAFERDVRELVEAGHAVRASAVLREAAKVNGHLDLLDATPTPGTLEVTGWDHVRRDAAAEACEVVLLRVIGRTPSSPDNDQGVLERTLADADGRAVALVPARTQHSVRVEGVRMLLDLLREPYAGASAARARRDVLGGWLVAALVVGAVGEACRRHPLPRPVVVEVGPHRTPHPREAGFDDLVPPFTWRLRPPVDSEPDAAEQLRRERSEQARADHQRTWSRDVAERREIHRLLQLFPRYRSGSRARIAEGWELRLRMTCDAVGLDPVPEIDWRMSPTSLAAVLHRVVAAKDVPDVEAALDPVQTDALHSRWVGLVRRGEARPQAPTSIFELELLSSLHHGGPVLRDRWERAGPYGDELAR